MGGVALHACQCVTPGQEDVHRKGAGMRGRGWGKKLVLKGPKSGLERELGGAAASSEEEFESG